MNIVGTNILMQRQAMHWLVENTKQCCIAKGPAPLAFLSLFNSAAGHNNQHSEHPHNIKSTTSWHTKLSNSPIHINVAHPEAIHVVMAAYL